MYESKFDLKIMSEQRVHAQTNFMLFSIINTKVQ